MTRAGVRRFVEVSLIEADGKGLHRTIRLLLHQRDNRGRIYSSGKEGSQQLA